ncbi:baseplate J/gp47 family protein [Crassaminicella profunda]|uniref:baseplate J/gp47 family protein n=1 Tax=Crassaminicella profunda TaxID=1286698 RepID=UPI001CA70CF6|nr:baseplate J/gp47 family protein [Crassaminicella profunda]QZY55095.1 baseplate J/gp47 family protein [Crassaminicella profunda]
MIDKLMNRMLSGIEDTYEKSEGSFFYDALKPIALELVKAYDRQEKILDQGFVETATGISLDKKVAEQGLKRKAPTKATTTVLINGEKGAEVKVGMKVSSDIVDFIVKEDVTIGERGQVKVLVECEQLGSIGNIGAEKIKKFPTSMNGFSSVTNPEPITNGYDGESDEALRQRYFDKVRTPATSGNKHHYRNWAKEVSRVEDARVFPAQRVVEQDGSCFVTKGNGLVEVVIIAEGMKAADESLINEVEEHINERRPIGAIVKVQSAQEVEIYVKVNLKINKSNCKQEQVITNIEENIRKYLKATAYLEGYISYAQIGSAILQAEGVLDYTNLEVYVGNELIDLQKGIDEIGEKQVAVLRKEDGVVWNKS